jgi:hypothetical protein
MLRKDNADEFKREIRAFSFTREGTMILVTPNTEDGKPQNNTINRLVPDLLRMRCYFSQPFLVCGKTRPTDFILL